jgi:hypothetical protein
VPFSRLGSAIHHPDITLPFSRGEELHPYKTYVGTHHLLLLSYSAWSPYSCSDKFYSFVCLFVCLDCTITSCSLYQLFRNLPKMPLAMLCDFLTLMSYSSSEFMALAFLILQDHLFSFLHPLASCIFLCTTSAKLSRYLCHFVLASLHCSPPPEINH